MKKLLQDVGNFHRMTGMPIESKPKPPAMDRVTLRRNLILEEVLGELIPAMDANNIVNIADALADSIYVIVGTALEYGIPLDKVWDEIQRSNMTKADPVNGVAIKREDGKILKPPTFSPPNLKPILV